MANTIYILTNEAMPGLIKIGKTDRDVEERVRELSRHTGVPLPFSIFYSAEVGDMNTLENALHTAFGDKRLNKSREFFLLSPEQLLPLIQYVEIKNTTPQHDTLSTDLNEAKDEEEGLEKMRKIIKKVNFNFQTFDIAIGATLTFKTDEHITATVINHNAIEYNGKRVSMSWAASEILQSHGLYRKSIQWPAYRKYDGELLIDRRSRYENNEEDEDIF